MHRTINFNEFPDGTIKDVWYSNGFAKLWVCVKPKNDELFYDVEFNDKSWKRCKTFMEALRYANGEESLIDP